MKVIFSDESWAYFLDAPTNCESDKEIEFAINKLDIGGGNTWENYLVT
jgi:hypothetical protein